MPRDRLSDPLDQHQDVDYVSSFETLAKVEIEIRRRGPSAHLLLRRAMLSMAVGNYAAALDAARDAVTAAPREPEAHYQEGIAHLWLARLQVGKATLGPGAAVPTQRPLRATLEEAYESFCAAAQWADDEEVDALASWLEQVLRVPDADLADRFRGAVV